MLITEGSQRAVGFLQQFSELRLITCRKTDKTSSTLIPDSTAMINNLNLFTLASVSPHFHLYGSAPCVSPRECFLKAITSKADPAQPRKPQRGALSFGDF